MTSPVVARTMLENSVRFTQAIKSLVANGALSEKDARLQANVFSPQEKLSGFRDNFRDEFLSAQAAMTALAQANPDMRGIKGQIAFQKKLLSGAAVPSPEKLGYLAISAEESALAMMQAGTPEWRELAGFALKCAEISVLSGRLAGYSGLASDISWKTRDDPSSSIHDLWRMGLLRDSDPRVMFLRKFGHIQRLRIGYAQFSKYARETLLDGFECIGPSRDPVAGRAAIEVARARFNPDDLPGPEAGLDGKKAAGVHVHRAIADVAERLALHEEVRTPGKPLTQRQRSAQEHLITISIISQKYAQAFERSIQKDATRDAGLKREVRSFSVH